MALRKSSTDSWSAGKSDMITTRPYISEARLANSIDDLLDRHSHDTPVQRVGKRMSSNLSRTEIALSCQIVSGKSVLTARHSALNSWPRRRRCETDCTCIANLATASSDYAADGL